MPKKRRGPQRARKAPKRFRKNSKQVSRGRLRQSNNFSRITTDRVTKFISVSAFVSLSFPSDSAYLTYRGNDLVNPGNGTWTNQPAGFFQWMAFYQRFRVLGSQIKIQGVNDGVGSLNRAIWVSIFPSRLSDTSLLGLGYTNAIAQPYSRGKFCGAVTAMDKVVVGNQISTTKIWGSNVMFDDDFTGVVDTAPANLWYWNIGLTGLSDGTDFPVLSFMVTITYKVIFYDRKPISMVIPTPPLQVPNKDSNVDVKENSLEFI
jgi:hypothetical protein